MLSYCELKEELKIQQERILNKNVLVNSREGNFEDLISLARAVIRAQGFEKKPRGTKGSETVARAIKRSRECLKSAIIVFNSKFGEDISVAAIFQEVQNAQIDHEGSLAYWKAVEQLHITEMDAISAADHLTCLIESLINKLINEISESRSLMIHERLSLFTQTRSDLITLRKSISSEILKHKSIHDIRTLLKKRFFQH